MKKKSTLLGAGVLAVAAGMLTTPAFAAVTEESQYIFNSLLFLIGGFLVMWMAAGFTMLEVGLVRTKNVGTMCVKNIGLYSIAGLMYFLVGYQLMYSGVSDGMGLMGTFSIWGADDAAARAGTEFNGYASTSDWFFQMVFVATAASIVSGTLAERIKLFPFFAFVIVLTGFIYPIQGSWEWGGGWLNSDGFIAFTGSEFSDFAGSTLVHSAGGWAALAGALILGPRIGKYNEKGQPMAIPGSSLPMATLGTFILWLGWFGFNGASQLAMGSAADIADISNIFANTNAAAAGGVVAAVLVSKFMYKKIDLTMALNGALAGLVSITAGPLDPTMGQAALIGAVGGIIVVFAVPFIDRLKIDDVVGAISVHLVAGIWGTMAVPLTSDGITFLAQATGVVSIGAFVLVASSIVWFALKYTIGIRMSAEDEIAGGDYAELGMEAYPEFTKGSQIL